MWCLLNVLFVELCFATTIQGQYKPRSWTLGEANKKCADNTQPTHYIGICDAISLDACKASCDQTVGCVFVSWDGYMGKMYKICSSTSAASGHTVFKAVQGPNCAECNGHDACVEDVSYDLIHPIIAHTIRSHPSIHEPSARSCQAHSVRKSASTLTFPAT